MYCQPSTIRTLAQTKKKPKIPFKRIRDTAASLFLAVCGLVLPFGLSRDKFSSEGIYWYVVAAFVLLGLHLVIANVIFIYAGNSKKFRHDPNNRRKLTLYLKRLSNVAFSIGTIGLTAGTLLLGSEDKVHLFVVWALLTALLYIFRYLLTDSAFAPENIQPITEKEQLDAAAAHTACQ